MGQFRKNTDKPILDFSGLRRENVNWLKSSAGKKEKDEICMARDMPPLLKKASLAVCCAGCLVSSGFAQTNGFIPVVTLRATDPFASWGGDTGTFTAFRDGPTNQTLNVFYRIAGSASNGVDCATLPNCVS